MKTRPSWMRREVMGEPNGEPFWLQLFLSKNTMGERTLASHGGACERQHDESRRTTSRGRKSPGEGGGWGTCMPQTSTTPR
jgi:hypothetical protein